MRHASLFAASVLAIATLAACEDKTAGTTGTATENESKMADRIVSLEQTINDMEADAVKVHTEPSPGVYFVNLRDGQTVTSPFRVVFGVYGMGIAPAGVDKENTGHHHLLLDTELTEEEKGFAIPNDAQHMHFGTGLTETVLQPPAGQHTLQLVFGDKNHELHKPAPLMSPKITITVK